MDSGWYSIIQYVPILARGESRNVGLIIVSGGRLMVDIVQRAGLPDGMAKSFKDRVEAEQLSDVKALTRFAATRGNNIQVTPPRPMRLDDLEKTFAVMFAELVLLPQKVSDG